MNAAKKTLTFAAVAAVAVIVALVTRYANQPNTVDGFAEVGEPFFENFTDPTKATALQVAVFDEDAKETNAFAVRQNDDGVWVIPSHHNYPAEAADRLARTAASFIGVTKSAVQSRSKEDWGEYGVRDPSKESLSDGTGCGTHVTISDASGNPLVNLIVGKPVPGREKTWYVREPEKNTTYLAELDVDLTAKFSDWIEPDLLKITQTDIVRMVKDNYFIDEAQGVIKQGETLTFEKENLETSGTWTLADLDPEAEEIVASPISALARNIDQLKIVGVRPKPDGINADLTVSPDVANNPLLLQVLQADMQKQGFYVAPGNDDKVRLFSNEGELIAGTDKGVEYTLYFGEIARGTARDLEVGFADADAEAKSEEGEGDSETTDPADDSLDNDSPEGPRRYLLVKVRFDESLLGPKPTEPVEPTKPDILNETDEKPAAAPGESAPTESATSEDDAKAEPGAAEPASPEADAADTAAPKTDVPESDRPEGSEGASDEPSDSCFVDEPVATGAEQSADEPVTEPESGGDQPATQETPSATDEKSEAAGEDPPAATEETAETQESATPTPAETAASDESSTPAPAAGQEQEPSNETAADEKPVDPTPAAEPVDPKVLAQQQYDAAMGEYEAAKAAWETDTKTWNDRAAEGRKNAQELATRFAGWYYVISAESFEKFKVTRVDVTKKKEADTEADGAATDDTPPFSLPQP